MRKYLFFVLVSLTNGLLGQNEPINNLKNASDKARDLILGTPKGYPTTVPTQFVNTFIGTGGHGHTYPGATAPFGMMQLSPDTRYEGWDGCGGYHYDDSIIYGFSHTHLSGTGISDYSDLLIVPQSTNEKPKLEPLFLDPKNGYGSKFQHTHEFSVPGYYTVKLLDKNIRVELTSAEHSGMHNYVFSEFTETKYILLDLDYRDKLLDSKIEVLSNTEISGKRISKEWADEQHFYFYLQTSLPFLSAEKIVKNGKHKLLLKFPATTREIQLRIGISAVDEKGAKNNVDTEIPEFNFQKVKSATRKKWDDELSKIEFDSEDLDTKKVFYTALYHSFLNPNVFSDVDGRYRGLDKEIHQLPADQKNQYSVFSLWDTFRATHPLFTITQPDKVNDFILTFLNMAKQGGDLPVWELAANETECMIGYHSVSVIADAYHKGIRNFDAELALAEMVKTANDRAYSKDFYAANGYLSMATEPESVSKILEYAYDDFCIAQMAADMGKMDIANEFYKRSCNFINHFDPETHFFRARRSGQWMSPFRPEEVNFNYTEANAWQYSLFAPHAVGIVKSLHGKERTLENHLDEMFAANSKTSGREQADITGLIGQYAHGNEPSHHMAYLYNYVGRPDKTQLYVDSILRNLYSTKPDGLSGNEDCGQMSSWYVLSALGLYQIAPGTDYYEIGRPIARKASIVLQNGEKFQIICTNQSKENKYIQSIQLNDMELNRLYLTHSEIINGGKLEILMGNQPSGIVNTYISAPSMQEVNPDFCPIPYFENPNRVFVNKTTVSIATPKLPAFENRKIEYRLDNGSWTNYETPFQIEKSTKVEARTLLGDLKSTPVETDFILKNTDISIELKSNFDHPYTAGGNEALIDGIEGNHEFRTGDWQGFFGKNVVAELSLKTQKNKFDLEIGVLEDVKSWIFYPESILVEGSFDGIHFVKIEHKKLAKMPSDYPIGNRQTILFQLEYKQNFQKIRVTAFNPGKCPEWHLGAGNPTWLFLDEIKIK